MDPAEAWASCVVFGELGAGSRLPAHFDWKTMTWSTRDGD
jgi:hypothetical protein